jgi:CheY-like chemotaxis protein
MALTSAHRSALAGLKILVVDDDADVLYLVRRILTEARAEVSAASNAQSALRNVALARPDLIISDLEMPGCDGYELIQQIRRMPADNGGTTPAIALSAHVREADRAKARAAGFDAHIAKPMRALRLIDAIVEAMAPKLRLGSAVDTAARRA